MPFSYTVRSMLFAATITVLLAGCPPTTSITATVPNVVGATQSAAESAIANASLVVGAVTQTASLTVPAGRIVSQSIPAGATVPRGTPVSISVSAGNAQIGIGSIGDLQKIGNVPGYPPDGRYFLTQDIDASETASWNGGMGFDPLPEFSGVLDGRDYTISGLFIYRPNDSLVGLFTQVAEAGEVIDLRLVAVVVDASNSVGGYSVGGLVGYNVGAVTNCRSTGSVAGDTFVGGLIGYNVGPVTDCSSTVTVVATGNSAGGLIGLNYGMVTSCDATGTVAGNSNIGGLVGESTGEAGPVSITACYATGAVSGINAVGGLVGSNLDGARVTACYARGDVGGQYGSGGLIGQNDVGWVFGTYDVYETVAGCYSTGVVTQAAKNGGPGGLVSLNSGVVADSFWDVETSRLTQSSGGAGKTTVQMMTSSTFTAADWDFVGLWAIGENASYPYLTVSGQVVSVPNLAGLPRTSADTVIADVGLTRGSVSRVASATVPSGGVVSQNPGKHSGVAPGTAVDLVVSRGPALVGVEIGSIDMLQRIGNDPAFPSDGTYYLSNDIDASTTAAWNIGKGFTPVLLGGIFDGRGHVITGLAIDRPGEDAVGLFKAVGENGEIRNLGLAGGSVRGRDGVGGLAANVAGKVTDCFSTNSVAGGHFVGGLIGGMGQGAAVSHCYAAGPVSGADNPGGLVGFRSGGDVTESFWDLEASGSAISDGGTGKTTVEMMRESTFADAGWDFATTWTLVEGATYPYFDWIE